MALSTSAASADSAKYHEAFCAGAKASRNDLAREYGLGQNLSGPRVAEKAETLAAKLVACARKNSGGTTYENDRLLVRAADAYYLSAGAHAKLNEVPNKNQDLQSVLATVAMLKSAPDPVGLLTYREAYMLKHSVTSLLQGMKP